MAKFFSSFLTESKGLETLCSRADTLWYQEFGEGANIPKIWRWPHTLHRPEWGAAFQSTVVQAS